jgi:excisionase family DNA binding protein/PAS domain S-box-containing protein
LISGTWLTIQDIARALDVRVRTVRRWVRNGELPVLQLGGSRSVYRVHQSDLERFVHAQYPPGSMDHLFSGTSQLKTNPQESSGVGIDLDGEAAMLASSREFIDRLPAVTFREALLVSGSPSFMSWEIESLLGHPVEDLLRSPEAWRDHIHPADRDAVVAELARTDATGEPFSMEYRMVRRDGEVVWIRVEANLTRDIGQDGLVWEGTVANITDVRELQLDLLTLQRQQLAIAELGRLALEHQTLTPVLNAAARQASLGLNPECVRVFEVLPGGDGLAMRSHECKLGASEAHHLSGSVDGLTLHALATCTSVASEALEDETRFDAAELVVKAGMSGGLSAIIPGRERPFGAITALFRDRRALGQTDVCFLQTLANTVAQVARQSERSWYDVDDVAQFLQVTEETVRRWIRRGDLPALNLGGPRAGYRVYPTDLERFILDRVKSN